MLTYTEMTLFLRAGDDMARPTFQLGTFLRYVAGKITMQHAGAAAEPYKPTHDDLKATNWRRA